MATVGAATMADAGTVVAAEAMVVDADLDVDADLVADAALAEAVDSAVEAVSSTPSTGQLRGWSPLVRAGLQSVGFESAGESGLTVALGCLARHVPSVAPRDLYPSTADGAYGAPVFRVSRYGNAA